VTSAKLGRLVNEHSLVPRMKSDTTSRISVYKLKTCLPLSESVPGYKVLAEGRAPNGDDGPYYRLCVRQCSPKTPAWLDVFTPIIVGPSEAELPHTMNAGFVLLVWVSDATYAATGGVGHYDLEPSFPIERRFGISLAERMLTLPELRGLEQKDTSGVVNYINRVFRPGYNPLGDIENLKRVLKSVRGKLADTNPRLAYVGSSIVAGDAVSAFGSKTFGQVIAFILTIDDVWRRGQRTLLIPRLEPIPSRSEAKLVAALDLRLADDITGLTWEGTGPLDPIENLFLDNEDVGYLPDRAQHFGLASGRTRSQHASQMDALGGVRKLLRGVPREKRADTYRRARLAVTFEDGQVEERPLPYFVCGDVTYQNEVYFIVNEEWYRAGSDFMSAVDSEIDNIACLDAKELNLTPWGADVSSEDDYVASNRTCHVLHKKLVRIPNERAGIEFCDLMPKQVQDIVNLVHVKHAYGAELRALLAQGAVSATAYAQNTDYRKRVHCGQLDWGHEPPCKDLLRVLDSLKARQKREMRVVFAIYDDAPSHRVKSNSTRTLVRFGGTLTPFAKVDLLHRVSTLRSLGYDVALTRIKPYPA